MDFVEICNVCARKVIIKLIFNSDKICRSYYYFYFGVTFLEHTVVSFAVSMMTMCGCCVLVHRYGGQVIGNRYGAGSGEIWLDDVQCSGTETSIRDCTHGGWLRHDCGHSEDVSISCNLPYIRKGLHMKK